MHILLPLSGLAVATCTLALVLLLKPKKANNRRKQRRSTQLKQAASNNPAGKSSVPSVSGSVQKSARSPKGMASQSDSAAATSASGTSTAAVEIKSKLDEQAKAKVCLLAIISSLRNWRPCPTRPNPLGPMGACSGTVCWVTRHGGDAANMPGMHGNPLSSAPTGDTSSPTSTYPHSGTLCYAG